MNIEHISVSRSQTYHECKLAYKYKYHLKLESPDPEPFYFVYGKIVHKIAEEYVANNGDRTLTEIAVDVLQQKIPIERNINEVFAPPLPDAYKQRLPKHLRAIKTITQQMGMGGHLEYKFRYDLDPPHGKFVTGFIDRLINKDGKWFILDYKTTKKGNFRKDRNSIVHDLQLRMYCRVVQKDFGVDAENIRSALLYLEDSELIGTKYSQESLLGAEKELLDCYNEISQTEAETVQGTVGRHCWNCMYKKRCPYFNAI